MAVSLILNIPEPFGSLVICVVHRWPYIGWAVSQELLLSSTWLRIRQRFPTCGTRIKMAVSLILNIPEPFGSLVICGVLWWPYIGWVVSQELLLSSTWLRIRQRFPTCGTRIKMAVSLILNIPEPFGSLVICVVHRWPYIGWAVSQELLLSSAWLRIEQRFPTCGTRTPGVREDYLGVREIKFVNGGNKKT
ncbi:hypothetical protein AVEN_159496-1 [Araneus ventricosus]|uniref:Uncharacterized protein n=1 Tax=Araneus ventricosus TaxID=182803 RepID=A0A4Y2A1U2_ARAVE|nr:hypothetical protein AVEN_159496-1 [Araneus ventricosus]